MKPKHMPCACGCNQLADECMGSGNPLAAFRIVPPIGSAFHRAEGHHPTATATPEGRWIASCTCGPECIDPATVWAHTNRQTAVDDAADLLAEREHGPSS